MNDINQGLPSVTAEKTTKKRDILFDEAKVSTPGTCGVCLSKNKVGATVCSTCQAPLNQAPKKQAP